MRRLTISLLFTMLSTMVFAQHSYVSKPIVDAMNSGKYYMKLSGIVEDQSEGTSVPVESEMATRGGVSMLRNNAMGMTNVVLCNEDGTFMLDEAKKTWQVSMMQQSMPTKLTFKKQYQCQMNGEEGWYCDEYKSSKGEVIRFYYNSNKVSIVDLGTIGGEKSPLMNLISFSSVIPQNMYFCVGKDWKNGSGSMGQQMMGAVGFDKESLIKQLKEEMSEEDLPEGMTMDEFIKMAMSQFDNMNTGATTTGGPVPPQCSTPWHDSGTITNIACGSNLYGINITGMQGVSSPMYADNFGDPERAETTGERFAVSADGIVAAVGRIKIALEGKTDSEKLVYMVKRNNDVQAEIAGQTANGETLEEAIATVMVYPTALSLNNVGQLYLLQDDAQRAKPYFEEALKMDPNNAIILTNMAETMLELDDLEEAKKYAEKALQQQPDFGSAQQILTTYYFKKNDNLNGLNSLLKTSLHYFDNITAQQVFYVYTLIQIARMEAVTKDYHDLFEKIYSKENLKLLEQMVKLDHEYNHQAVSIPEKTYYPWPVEDASMTKYYKKKEKALEKVKTQWQEKISEAENSKYSPFTVYNAMGAGTLQQNIAMLVAYTTGLGEQIATQSGKKAVDELNNVFSQINLPSADQMMQAYRVATKMYAGKKDALSLEDARQFYGLILWSQYIDIRRAYAAGKLATEDANGNLIGTYPAAFKTYRQAKEAAEKTFNANDQIYTVATSRITKEFMADLEAISPNASDLARAKAGRVAELKMRKAMLEATTHYANSQDGAALAELRAYREFYNSSIKPAMEESYTNTFRYTSFCHNQYICDWFHYMNLVENTDYTFNCYSAAIDYGETRRIYRNMANEMAELYGADIPFIEQEINDIEEQEKEAAKPKPEEPKPMAPEFFFNADFVLGKVEFSISDDAKISVAFTNNGTGKTHNFNLTDRTYVCTQSYPVVSDAERNGRTDAQIMKDNSTMTSLKMIASELIGKIPKVGETINKAISVGESAKQFGSVEDSKFRSVSMDAAGNHQVMSSGLKKERDLTFLGTGVKLGSTATWTGNVKNVRHHAMATVGNWGFGVRF